MPTSSPTVTPTESVGFYGRGDADCTVTLSAADVTGTVRGMTGQSTCHNDDCDRDGQVTATDVDCAARCLFGECPVPPYAPQIAAVLPHSAPGIAPLSVVRVVGTNFGSGERLRRMVVGGAEAQFIDAPSATEWLVVVPEVPPGIVDVVALNGDLTSAPFPISVVPRVPIGAADTFEGVLDLLDALVEQFVTLDLDSLYGQSAAAVRAALENFRQELGAQRAALQADPSYTAEVRAVLDAVFDGVGLPDMLRSALDAFTGTSGQAAGHGGVAALAPTIIARVVGQTTRVMATQLVRVAPVVELPALASVGAALGIMAAVVVVVADAPVITKVIPDSPRPGKIIEVEGQGFGTLPPLPSLLVKTKGGTIVVPAQGSSGGLLQYRFPAAVGVCGRVGLALQRLLKESNTVTVNVQPVLTELLNTTVLPGQDLTLRAFGAVGCPELRRDVEFRYVVNSQPVVREIGYFSDVAADFLKGRVPERLPPATYGIRLNVGGIESAEELSLRVENPIEALGVTCGTVDGRLERLLLPPGEPSVGVCIAFTKPEGTQVPLLASFYWTSTNPTIVALDHPGLAVDLRAAGSGEAGINVEMFVPGPDGTPRSLAHSDVGYQVRVEDAPPATLTPTGTATATPTSTPTPTSVPSNTPIPTASKNVTPTRTRTASPTPTATGAGTGGARAFVANSLLDNVSVIDLVTRTPITAIAVQDMPVDVAIHPSGLLAYVANETSSTISIIDTVGNQVASTISLGQFPDAFHPKRVAFTPSGAKAYVTGNRGRPQPDGSQDEVLAVINVATEQMVATVHLQQPGVQFARGEGVAITPDGRFAYVTVITADLVAVIDATSNALVTTVPVGDQPTAIAITPDGETAYAWNQFSHNVSIITLANNSVRGTIPIGDFSEFEGGDIAVARDGSFAWLVAPNLNHIYLIDTATSQVATLSTSRPERIVFGPDGALAYITARGSPGYLEIWDTARRQRATRLRVGDQPKGLAVAVAPPQ